jgi:hypothetical protein
MRVSTLFRNGSTCRTRHTTIAREVFKSVAEIKEVGQAREVDVHDRVYTKNRDSGVGTVSESPSSRSEEI